jgi:hypothetical protein
LEKRWFWRSVAESKKAEEKTKSTLRGVRKTVEVFLLLASWPAVIGRQAPQTGIIKRSAAPPVFSNVAATIPAMGNDFG